MESIRLNVPLLRKRVKNLTSAARSAGLRPATVSNLCTGKIPVERAEVRTIVALASLANCSLDELILRGETVKMIETKIKTIDLFAPIVKGGTIGLVARPGMGQLVVLAELLYRLKQDGYKTVLLKPQEKHPDLSIIMEDVDAVVGSIDQAYAEISKLSENHDIIFTADRSHILTGELYDLQQQLDTSHQNSVTTFLLDLKGESVDESLPYGPLDTLWQFDADLAARHLYPAINPNQSTSSILEGAGLDENHFLLQHKAQKLLRRYRELRSIVNVNGVKGIPSSEIEAYTKGERLEAYLTQPFYVAESLTGQKGQSVKLEDTLKDVQRIIDGDVNSKEVSSLTFIGNL